MSSAVYAFSRYYDFIFVRNERNVFVIFRHGRPEKTRGDVNFRLRYAIFESMWLTINKYNDANIAKLPLVRHRVFLKNASIIFRLGGGFFDFRIIRRRFVNQSAGVIRSIVVYESARVCYKRQDERYSVYMCVEVIRG